MRNVSALAALITAAVAWMVVTATAAMVAADIRRASGRSPVTVAAVAAVALGLFGGLAYLSHRAVAGTSVDHAVLRFVLQERRGWLTALAIVVTDGGSPTSVALVGAVASAVLWWRWRTVVPAAVVMGTLGAAAGASTLAKHVVAAQRPPVSSRAAALVHQADPSFPSGHTVGTMALVGILAALIGSRLARRLRIALVTAAAVAAMLVGATRVYLGVHWVTDVAGGLMLGGATAVIGSVMFGWWTARPPGSARSVSGAAPGCSRAA